MKLELNLYSITGWLFGLLVFTLGMMNVFLVHPVPGIIYIFLSLLFFPPVNEFLKSRFKIRIPALIKFILGFIIIWFTIGISDLGEIMGF